MSNYQPAKKTRRFIAGTRCPKCNEADKTVLYTNDEGVDVRECVHCGFKQSMNEQLDADAVKAAELATRVSAEGKPILDEGEKPLKIVGFMAPNSDNH